MKSVTYKILGVLDWCTMTWTHEEDKELVRLVRIHGPGDWTILSERFHNKNGKQVSSFNNIITI